MQQSSSTRAACLAALLLLVSGCGGGGQPPRDKPPPEQAAPTFLAQDAAQLVRSGYCASTWVQPALGDSAHCSDIDDDTQITFDGRPQDRTVLYNSVRGGSITVVSGSSPGRVTSIDVQHVAVGTIDSVEPAHARIRVLGQRVYVFDPSSTPWPRELDDLAPGDRVSVSGFMATDGAVVATTISDVVPDAGFVLRGVLHEAPGGGFRIGDMRLDLAGATLDEFAGGAPMDGDAVLALADAAPAGGALAVSSLRFTGSDWTDGTEDTRYLIGTITSAPSPDALTVEGHPIDCSAFPCASLTELQAQPGQFVAVTRVEGVRRVEQQALFWESFQVSGPVDTLDAPNDSLHVLGFPVQLLPTSQVMDDASRPKSLDDIEIGISVTAGGVPVGDVIVAGSLQAPSDNEPSIKTYRATFAAPEIHVLGRTILTSPATPVFEDCVGERDQPWLFEAAVDNATGILVTVSVPDGDDLIATRIDADTGACDPWGY